MKKIILNIYNDYKIEFKEYYNKIKKKIANLYREIKKSLSNKENRKKYLTTTAILLIINLLLVNLYISYGYYYEEAGINIVHAKVGNMYSDEYDYVLLVYLEDTDTNGNGSGNYYLAKNIPALGYNYSGYKCQNNSTLIYDDETNTTSVTTTHKDICSVYFDIIGSMDLTVKVMLEESVGSNSYTLGERIPAYGYKYSHYECSNNGTLEYDSELHKVIMSADSKEHCNIYFIKEKSDVTVNLFIEQNYQTADYIERVNIPANIVYTLNESKSSCKNNDDERVDTLISYVDGYINVGVGEVAVCDIYLDINNE